MIQIRQILFDMALQNLTPGLRTRLSRVERTVGFFVAFSMVLMLIGFAYYIYHTGVRKGWFDLKLPYHTRVNSGTGLKVGDTVKLLGFDVGEITKVESMGPEVTTNRVFVQFIVRHPYEGYIWDDSKIKVTTGDFLGKRVLDLIPGGTFRNHNLHATYKVEDSKIGGVFKKQKVGGVFDPVSNAYVAYDNNSKGYALEALESPALTDRFEEVARDLREALPNILGLTNQLFATLTNAVQITSKANTLLRDIHPSVTNLAIITGTLTNPKGSLGDWLIPTNIVTQVEQTLVVAKNTITNANTTLIHVDAQLTALAGELERTLSNIADITSNLNSQVQGNTNLISSISDTIVHTDEMIQGLKKHWLLRSAFKKKDSSPPVKPSGK
ncbi:MAG: MCE family protein [Pedosphaera sp.]|nr:MCE family protein [Pedosphaera sp.]